MAYQICGVELGDDAPPPLNPGAPASSSGSWTDMFSQIAQSGAQGATTGFMNTVQNLLNPKPPVAPPQPSAMQYVIPVLALATVAGGAIYMSKKR